MGYNANAEGSVITITLAASGEATISPVLATSQFKDPSVVITPLESTDVQYSVEMQMNGQTFETHSYPTASDVVVALLSYPEFIFPPNTNGRNRPACYMSGRRSVDGVAFSLVITNLSAETRTFKIDANWLAFEAGQTQVLSAS